MKLRGYIGALVLVLTLLGLVNQQEYTLPNQEIVLEFTDAEVASTEAQRAIALVQKQLQVLGAENIQVKEDNDGHLIITYYSTSDVASIKKSLSESQDVILGYTSDNKNNGKSSKSIPYSIDVFEIQDGNKIDWNLNGHQVVDLKTEAGRSLLPIAFISSKDINEKENANWVKVTLNVHEDIALTIDKNSENIPEVRAGPIC